MAGISSKALGKMETSYKFNAGTELYDDLGIAMYETPCRGYDAQIGRFIQIDPMADSYGDWSPYSFAFADPVFWNDPWGQAPNQAGKFSNQLKKDLKRLYSFKSLILFPVYC
jgi:RHS repeat-associated protein